MKLIRPAPVEDLLPLLAFAAYWIFRAMRGSNKKKRGAQPASSAPTGQKAPTPFEQLMAQLEQALEEPGDADAADLADPVERQAERPPAPRAAPRPPRAVPAGFDDQGDAIGDYEGFDHEEHGFGQENPYSEEVFEQRPRFAPRPTVEAPAYDPHGLSERRSNAAPRGRAVSWSERLHDPAAAREALVLKTIFEGPWKPRTGGTK